MDKTSIQAILEDCDWLLIIEMSFCDAETTGGGKNLIYCGMVLVVVVA